MAIQNVIWQKQRAVVFNDVGECATIEGAMLTRLVTQVAYRKSRSLKGEKTILRDVLESWPREHLRWVNVREANK